LPPYNYVSKGKVVGLHTRLVKHILDSLDIQYTLNAYPWARSYQLAQSKPNVLIYTINRTPHREQSFHWIGQFPLTNKVSFFRLANPLLTSTDFSQLHKLRVGTQINSANDQYLTQRGFKKISRVSHISQTIGM